MTQATQATQATQGAGGNTKPQPSRQRSRKWSFTLNNYTEEEYDTITQACNNKDWKYIIGKEVGESGTPHLQGFIEHTNAISFDLMKQILPRAHIEKSKGTTQQNLTYCSKDNDFHTNIKVEETYQDKINKYNNDLFKDITWYDWQQDILDMLETEPHRRTIHWIWDPEGNSGKSFLTRYIHWKFDTIIVNGKQSDVFNGIKTYIDKTQNSPKAVIIDIPRTNKEYVCYGTMEKIKDGLMYSGKYEGGVIELLPVHLIVFANFEPDKEKMSIDRWNIVNCTR